MALEETWPSWSESADSELLADVYFKTSFTNLVDQLWNPKSQFIKTANSYRYFINYNSTSWKMLEDIISNENYFCNDEMNIKFIDFKDKAKKVKYDTQASAAFFGNKFKNEELQRCIEFVKDKKLVVDACVSLTAPFCDKFRPICRYKIEYINDDCCHLNIQYQISFIKPVNAYVRNIIQKPIKSGITKNFELYLKALMTYVPMMENFNTTDEILQENHFNRDNLNLSNNTKIEIEDKEKVYEYTSIINYDKIVPQIILDKINKIMTGFEMEFPMNLSYSISAGFYIILIMLFLFCVKFLSNILIEIKMDWTKIFYCIDIPDNLSEVICSFILLELFHYTFYQFTSHFHYLTKKERKDNIEEVTKEITEEVREELSVQAIINDANESNQSVDNEENIDTLISPLKLTKKESENQRDEKFAFKKFGISEIDLLTCGEDNSSILVDMISFFKLSIVTMSILFYHIGKGFHSNNNKSSNQINEDNDDKKIITEEIYEHERWQPVRGWGHSRPGHFLLTDKYNHWTIISKDGTIKTSSSFENVEPKLNNDYEWIDTSWKIDIYGYEPGTVDSNGWQYANNFAWLPLTYEPNYGKKDGMSFVRRRRWIRNKSKINVLSTSYSMMDFKKIKKSKSSDSIGWKSSLESIKINKFLSFNKISENNLKLDDLNQKNGKFLNLKKTASSCILNGDSSGGDCGEGSSASHNSEDCSMSIIDRSYYSDSELIENSYRKHKILIPENKYRCIINHMNSEIESIFHRQI